MGCDHNCEACEASCEKQDLMFPANAGSQVKQMLAVVSGKGGVGKSTVTALLAAGLARQGYRVGVLDADVTGPSMARAFGVHGPLEGDEQGMLPQTSVGGIKVLSANLLLEHEDDPVLWRGPLIAGVIKQFWTDTAWGELDYLLIDMPPGTGDVPLTVFQSLPVDWAITVTTPQQLVSMIVGKAVNMAHRMNIPMLALVENMSYLTCPDCGRELLPFGESHAAELAAHYGIPCHLRLPLDPAAAAACDNGQAEQYISPAFDALIDEVLKVK